MRRELGIARCGLACCLCTESCEGCGSGMCPDTDTCENRLCSLQKGLAGCCDCTAACRKGLLAKVKPRAFRLFVQRYGSERLLDCLERNEKQGVVYHRHGFEGDYDAFADEEALIDFLLTEKQNEKTTDSV